MHEKGLVLTDKKRDTFTAKLAQQTEGFVGSDLAALCREAGMLAMRAGVETVTLRYFEEAQAKVHATMNSNLRDYYTKIQQHFKGGLPKQVQPPEYQ